MNEPARKRPVVAVFDFDGTLTRGDSLKVFLRQTLGLPRFVAVGLRSLPQLFGFGLGLIPRGRAKEAVLVRSLAGLPLDQAQATAERFAHGVIPRLLQPVAMARLRWHQQAGHPTVLLSASPELYLIPWAKSVGITTVLATRLEIRDGRLTGRLDGANCYGPEKVRRLTEHLGDRQRYEIHAYGDSAGDRELLASADVPYYRTFSR